MSIYRTPPSYHIHPHGLVVAINGEQHLLAMDPCQLIALAERALVAARIALHAAALETPTIPLK
ncbi:MAG: hypothetical protein WD046_13850 [Paracoccaceae bacterium]